MKAIRSVLACLRKADQTYDLIHHGDKIVIGLSGGKDSIALTYALSLYRKFSHTDFLIQPVTLDLGFPDFDPTPLQDFCLSLGLTLMVSDNRQVYPILKQNQGKHDHLPCSICSRMKKAAINKVAKELGYNKVAFAHHADDAIETLFMNEIYGAKIATFSPQMHLERADITFIRPLILTRESDIIRLAKEEHFPVRASACPADKFTTREDIKQLLHQLYIKFPTAKENFLTMLTNWEKEDVWGKEIAFQITPDGFSLHPVTSPRQFRALYDIRHRVFVEEQKIPYEVEFVEEEEEVYHYYLFYVGDTPMGCIAYEETEEGIYLHRFALLKQYRHRGYGEKGFAYFLSLLIARHNPCTLLVHAQKYLLSFYEKQGFISFGDVFLEGGIEHIKMKRICE